MDSIFTNKWNHVWSINEFILTNKWIHLLPINGLIWVTGNSRLVVGKPNNSFYLCYAAFRYGIRIMELGFALVFRCRLGLGLGSGPGHGCWNGTWDGHSNLDSEPRCIGIDMSCAISPGSLGPRSWVPGQIPEFWRQNSETYAALWLWITLDTYEYIWILGKPILREIQVFRWTYLFEPAARSLRRSH